MTSLFKDYYLVESAKEYKYRIKLAVNDLSSEQKAALEDALAKFDVRSVGPFAQTPIQKSPLDFPNVRNTQVYTTEIVLGYPTTVDALRVFLSDKVGINQQEIAVYNQYDPRDANTEAALAIEAGIDEDNYTPALGNDYPADEKPDYGKEYNEKFLKELEDVRKARPVVEVDNPLMQKTKVDNTSVAPRDVGEAGGYSVMGGKGTDGPQS